MKVRHSREALVQYFQTSIAFYLLCVHVCGHAMKCTGGSRDSFLLDGPQRLKSDFGSKICTAEPSCQL